MQCEKQLEELLPKMGATVWEEGQKRREMRGKAKPIPI
jgi:hypothetical protein